MAKDSARIQALGDIDELNSSIGVLLAEKMPAQLRDALLQVQHGLFDLGGEVCIPGHRMITEAHVAHLDALLAEHNKGMPPLKEFILPGGTRAAALAHLSRTVCRRAERSVVALGRAEPVGERARQYLNRLSDLLFVLGRALNRAGQARRRAVAARAQEKGLTMRTLLLALLFVPLAAAAQAPETLFNLVSLNAQAEREVPNDLLTATLAAEAEGADPAQLADGVNRTMQRALVDGACVQVREGPVRRGYQTIPVYDKSRVARWRVRQELRLESADFAAATELIGKLQASLMVTGMNLSVSGETRRKAENALIAEALAAFEERARVVRDAMKAKGYRVRDLQISPGGAPPRPMLAMAARALVGVPAQPALEPGSTRILITVSGTIQLQ